MSSFWTEESVHREPAVRGQLRDVGCGPRRPGMKLGLLVARVAAARAAERGARRGGSSRARTPGEAGWGGLRPRSGWDPVATPDTRPLGGVAPELPISWPVVVAVCSHTERTGPLCLPAPTPDEGVNGTFLAGSAPAPSRASRCPPLDQGPRAHLGGAFLCSHHLPGTALSMAGSWRCMKNRQDWEGTLPLNMFSERPIPPSPREQQVARPCIGSHTYPLLGSLSLARPPKEPMP